MPKENDNHLVQITPAQPRKARLSLDEARARLAEKSGPRYWRSLEALAREEGFDAMMEREFPRQASEWLDPVSRRSFLRLMGASMALAGLTGCTKQPHEHIVPYVKQPEGLIPGKPQYFATAMPLPTGALPVLVESHEGRPTKVEGNPQHPASPGGATHAWSQASILDLYDPDRARTINALGEVQSWGRFVEAMRGPLAAQKGVRGRGFRILSETVISPTLANQIQGLLQAMPEAKWVHYDPVNRDNVRAGSRLAFGQYLEPQYKLAGARVIVSLDADFLSGAWFPGFLRYSREYMSARKTPGPNMPRLYVVESTPTTTGAKADHQYRMKASEVENFAAELAAALGAGGASTQLRQEYKDAARAVAADLQQHRGTSVVIPGEHQSPNVHALAAAINGALGNAGQTVVYTDPIEFNPMEQVPALRELVGEMNAGKVDLLLLLGGNPVFDAPSDLKFSDALNKVAMRVHLSPYTNETSALAQWHINQAHYLESWSDARAFDGTVSILQPLIAPLYDGRTAHELINAFSDTPGLTSYEIVQRFWRTQRPGGFVPFWRKALHDGLVEGTAFAPRTASAGRPALQLAAITNGLELTFRPDPSIYDGRFNNNAWLQETPKPLSKLCWDNAVFVGLRTAERLNLRTQDVVELEVNGSKVKAPVYMLAGQPDDCLTVHLGYGRQETGRVGKSTGFNPYRLRTTQAMGYAPVKLSPTGDEYKLAITQEHNAMAVTQAQEREIIREASLAHFQQNPNFAQLAEDNPDRSLSLYPEYDYSKGYAWGMAIELSSCVGCNSCVVACQAENNISVVGKDQVMRGRELQWLRIDTYYDSRDMDNPRAFFQPLPCMHCELAPCEPVCPVGATVHSAEGLNDMVYNRCVGTRYCSNNCPYKVRRFNFTLYADWNTESLKGMRNPDVTVRSRGIMEKCTYCVQRINEVRFEAQKEDRPIRDLEVVTACQQTCPTGAIVFGNLNDPNSRVAQLKKDSRNYALLGSLQTRPRTTYLAEVTNPNTALKPSSQAAETKTHGG